MRALGEGTGGDPNARDIARILRVPSFVNHKHGKSYKVRATTPSSGTSYSLSSLSKVFGELETRHALNDAGGQEVPSAVLPPEHVRVSRYRGYLQRCEWPGAGARNGHLYKLAAAGVRDFALEADQVEELLEEYGAANDSTGDDLRIPNIVRNASRSASGHVGRAVAAPTSITFEDE
jgi:hypothetical protein